MAKNRPMISVSGIPSPTDDPIVEAVRSASKRVLGTRLLSRKESLSSTLIHEIVKKSDLENPVVLRNVTMYVLSFAGFFRFDDVSRIRRSDISFKEGFMVIKVLKSKNDQLRRSDEVVVSQLSSPACAVELLKKYLAMFKIPPGSNDLEGRAIVSLFPLINQLVTLLIEGIFIGTCKVWELNLLSLVYILCDLGKSLLLEQSFGESADHSNTLLIGCFTF